MGVRLRALSIVIVLGGPALADDEVTIKGAQAGGFSSRIKVEDHPREVTDAASLVEGEPGVHVRRLGGEDSFASLSIRGASSSQVAIVLAGVPLTGGGTPAIDLSSLPLWPGVRARVFRTFAPASLGPGSLGGTLAWDAPNANEKERIETWAAIGSFGSMRVRSGAIQKLDNMRLAMGASASRSDNDYTYWDPFDREFRKRENAGHAQGSAIASLTAPYKLSGGREGTITALVLAQAREQGVPGSVYVPTPNQVLHSDRELATVMGTHPTTKTVSAYAQWWARREGFSIRDAPDRDPSRSDSFVMATGAHAGVRGRPFAPIRADVRIEGRGEKFDPTRFRGSSAFLSAFRTAIAGASDVEWMPRDWITAAISGRLEHLRDTTGKEDANETTLATAHAGTEVLWNDLAFAWHGGYVSRPPSFLERFGTTGGYLATPNLKSESAWALDWGARGKRKWKKLEVGGELVGFATFASDLIVFVPQGFRGQLKASNIGQANLAGLESRAQGKWGPLELRASYTLTWTENRSACTSLFGCPPLPGRPLHDLVIDTLVTAGMFRFRWGLDVVAGMKFDTAGLNEIPARALQSIGIRFKPSKEIEWSVDVRNLTDERTATYPSAIPGMTTQQPLGDAIFYPLPGRTALLSVKITTAWDEP